MFFKKARQIKRLSIFALDYIKKYGIDAYLDLLDRKLISSDDFGLQGIWYVRKLINQPFKHLCKEEQFDLWKRGFIKDELILVQHNKIIDAFKHALIANMVSSPPAAADDVLVDYVGLGTASTNSTAGVAPDPANDTQLQTEFYRAAPTSKYRSNSTFVSILALAETDANPTNTTVASGASATQFDVQAGQGTNYAQYDLIRVFINGQWENVVVASVSTDTITLHASTPLSQTPSGTEAVQRMFGAVMQFCGAASGTANTGTPVNHSALEFAKTSSTYILVENHINFITAA